ncbi:MAG: hypothetical protein GY773_33840 [Actinomycetia bacterium]|nr:hypothetical protein [Actinomycetes bacterium]
MTIIDNSDGPHLSADAAYELLGGDTNPQRVYLLAAQIRNRRQRRGFLHRVGTDHLARTNGHAPGAQPAGLFDRRAS